MRDDQVPEFGSGVFGTAKGSQEVLGTGKTLITYRVEVETGIDWGEVEPVTPDGFAATIDEVWKDRRSWTGSAAQPVTEPAHGLQNASWRFQRVSGPQYDVRVRLATPGTVDAQCAAQGYDTGGKFSCKIGTTIMINLRRWLQGSPISRSVDGYHAGVINHEMGHFLGFDHQGCPGKGELAPAMMQQSMGLNGCLVNPWPFTVDGTFVTGPYLTS
ncbi:DUF3152 domain-containing protein [Catenuloplanes sp. NPDC051500]|uniref:DUF3152 domain-containing protein n=1 Tax=Catenuloplanes sp. NPDC051500 TaxID=3363959 RepID=UPI00378C2D57